MREDIADVRPLAEEKEPRAAEPGLNLLVSELSRPPGPEELRVLLLLYLREEDVVPAAAVVAAAAAAGVGDCGVAAFARAAAADCLCAKDEPAPARVGLLFRVVRLL